MEDLVYDNLWDKCTECEQNKKIITTNSDDSLLVNRQNGETFNSNDTEMINSTKDNVETLAADKALSDLSEEQLRDVLEQLTDHNLPDSQKCPLVQRLNAENASKDESDLVISTFCKSSTPSTSSSTCRSSNRKSRYMLHKTGSKDAEFVRDKTNGNNAIKKVHYSQSLQDLMSANSEYDSTSMRSVGVNRSGGKRLNKANRANSFTMPSGSQNFCNNNNSKETCSELSSSPDLMNSSNLRTNNSQQAQGGQQQASKSNRSKNVKSRPTSYISTSSVNALCENESNNCTLKSNLETCDYKSEVLSSSPLEPTISSRTYQECYATQSVHIVHDRDNHNMDCDKNSTSLCNSAHKLYPEEIGHFEMKDMGKRVKHEVYGSAKQMDSFDSDSHSHNNKTSNNVDSFLDLGLTRVNSTNTIKTGIAERMYNHNSDYDSTDLTNLREDNKLLQTYQGNESMTKTYEDPNPTDPDLANFQPISPHTVKSESTARNANIREKKKKKAEPTIKAEEIEGHIGFKDVEYLEAFVNSSGNEPPKQLTDLNGKDNGSLILNTSSNVKESAKKKEKATTMSTNSLTKRKNGNNVTPNQSACGTDSNKNTVTPNIPSSTSSSSFSSDEANSVSKHSEFAQKTDSILMSEATSPLNSSSHNEDKTAIMNREDSISSDDQKLSHSIVDSTFTLISNSNVSVVDEQLYAASDSEMVDREKGFVTPKSKHLKRRKGLSRRGENYRHQRSPVPSMQSSTSTTPPSSTVSGTAVYARGYESEREYTDECKQKQDVTRRKSTSSVPHSEQNSAYNSDGELSSHSMPVRNDSHNGGNRYSQSRTTPSSVSSTPKASYADIAKSFNLGAPFYKRASADAIYRYTNNAVIEPISINTSVQYEDFPQLDLSLPPVADVSTPSSPLNNSKMIEALVSPPPKSISEKRDLNVDSYSAPTSMINTPIPQNECLSSETVKISNKDIKTAETAKGSVVPPVIMCDYSDSVPLSDIGSVTFGFFDDLNTTSDQQTIESEKAVACNDSPEQKAKSPINPSPETVSHMNNPKVSSVHLTYIDVDKKSFNYEHIIGFIRKAWDNAKRDYQIESYESTNQVK